MTRGEPAASDVSGAAAEALRRRLPDGVEGLFLKLPTTETLEAAAAHFDFCIVDLEHSTLGESEAFRLLRHARAIGFPALVRLPGVDRPLVNRLLEAGAIGIQISNVVRCDDVLAARAAMRFPPEGSRSASTAHAGAGFGAVPLREYVEQSAPCLLVAQIEDTRTEDPLEEILRAGADVAFVGTSDLSVAAGFDAVAVGRRVDEIAAAAASTGTALGGFALDHEACRYRVSCSDVSLFSSALAAREVRPPRPPRPCATTWDAVPSEPVRPGIVRRGFGTSACLLVLNTCEPGMELRPHSHEFDQIALILAGRGRYHVGGAAHEVGPGSVLLVPAGVTHFMETVDEVVENLDVFAPTREDYLHLIEWMREPDGTPQEATS